MKKFCSECFKEIPGEDRAEEDKRLLVCSDCTQKRCVDTVHLTTEKLLKGNGKKRKKII